MILADIGNRHIHIFDGSSIFNLNFNDAINRFGSQNVKYISVNFNVEKKVKKETSWENISKYIYIDGEYDGMGVDRKALCLSRGDGIYIDAGSAITVDKVCEGRYIGGMIFLGLFTYKSAYKSVSERLNIINSRIDEVNFDMCELPKETENQIKYSIIKPIVDSVNLIRDKLPIYVTGGDGLLFSKIIKNSYYSDTLVFEGMKKVLKNKKLHEQKIYLSNVKV